MDGLFVLYIFMFVVFIGYEIIVKVLVILYMLLMFGFNFIYGVVVVGVMIMFGLVDIVL